MSRHVGGLLSAAYDGELSPDARASFDRHLAECAGCAAAFAELTIAVDVLREQGPARMPRPVRLPEGAPMAQRRFASLLARPGWSRGLTGGLAAAGTVAAVAAVAAVVVVGHLNPGLEARSPAAAHGAGGSYAQAAPGGVAAPINPASGCNAGGCSAAQVQPEATPAACAATTLSVTASSAARIPTGFNNHATNDDGSTKVVIATQASSFTPGETIDVYARVIDDETGAVYLPCTSLETSVSDAKAALALPNGPILATPAAGIAVAGGPVLQVTIPLSTTPDQTYQIVVEVPVAAGEAQTREVALSIQVT
ncbi:MAG: zf-HC2 domain-containing protein [Candidatus Dormibacteria bacterium]